MEKTRTDSTYPYEIIGIDPDRIVVTDAVHVFVPGIPAPGGSKRAFAFRRRDGSIGANVVDAAKRNKPWRAAVALAASKAFSQPLDGAVMVSATFCMPRPKGHYRSGKNAHRLRGSAPLFAEKRPDATKLWRAVEDALTGIAWKDDAQVVHQIIDKRYSEKPGLHLWVRTVTVKSLVEAMEVADG